MIVFFELTTVLTYSPGMLGPGKILAALGES